METTIDYNKAPIFHNHPSGYVRISVPNHPLAGKNGAVPRHRAVLYDALGWPDETSCFWCGYTLPWLSRERPATFYVVNVDHLNSTPGDDRVDNLVPACGWCNAHRNYMPNVAPSIWSMLLRNLADTHPSKRPNPLVILAVAGCTDWIERWPKGDE